MAWGLNDSGQCFVPFDLTGVVAIQAEGYHSLALKSDGTVVAWGDNCRGESLVPGDLTDVTAIAAGGHYSLALKSDGTVVGWGENGASQSEMPRVSGKVLAIAAGMYNSLALVGSDVTLPRLDAVPSGNSVILSWPASAQNFTLQATTNLVDAGSWTTMTNVPVIVDQHYAVSDPMIGSQRFYRLKQQ